MRYCLYCKYISTEGICNYIDNVNVLLGTNIARDNRSYKQKIQ
jgi:hypothetical protein